MNSGEQSLIQAIGYATHGVMRARSDMPTGGRVTGFAVVATITTPDGQTVTRHVAAGDSVGELASVPPIAA
jgi:hypothetical protein